MFVEYIFHIYGVNVREWLICQVADNFSPNLLIELLEIPLVGCHNHQLALEMRKMMCNDGLMRSTVDSIRTIKRFYKQKLRNRDFFAI